MDQVEEPMRIVRVISDPTDRTTRVHVVPDTHARAAAIRGDIEVIPVLPGSAYDRGPVR